MTDAGMQPDEWQAEVLRSFELRVLLLCSRQSGKSQIAAAVALLTALREPGSLILLLSPSHRQSGELFRAKLLPLYDAAFRNVVRPVQQSALSLELANGSRVVSLPGTPDTILGFSNVALIVIDEAARVDDDLYRMVRPMLAVSRGRLMALSTPRGKRGWFYEAWEGRHTGVAGDADPWDRYTVTAGECPRIPPAFLAEERLSLGDSWYAQEYCCSFNESVDAVFSVTDIQNSLTDGIPTVF